MPAPEPASRRPARIALTRLLQGWHRTVGVVAALFLVFLGGTGVMLMHSDRFGLPAQQVQSRWLLDWYGIRPPPPPRGYQRDGHWFSEAGGRLYFDTIEIPHTAGVLLGAFRSDGQAGEWLVVTDLQAVTVDEDGKVLERFGREAGLPADLTAAGLDAAGAIILASASARFRYAAASGEFVAASPAGTVAWSSGTAPPTAIANAIARSYSGDGISVERVLLDLHSGRLFGAPGVVVVDLAALVLLFLATSGLYLWFRRVRGRAAR